VSFKEILEVFFVIHDPTYAQPPGPRCRNAVRSAIFYHSAEQKAAAEQVIAKHGRRPKSTKPIVTEVRTGLKVLRGGGSPSGILPAKPRTALLRFRGQAESRKIPEEFSGKTEKK